MFGKKYLKDYEIVTSVNEKGKPYRDAVYVAQFYHLKREKEADKIGKILAIPSIAGMILWILTLLTEGAPMRNLVTAIAYVFVVWPLFTLLTGFYNMWRHERPFIHQDADAVSKRIPDSGVFIAILGAVSFVGALVVIIKNPGGGFWGNFLFLFSSALFTAIGIYTILHRKSFAVISEEEM